MSELMVSQSCWELKEFIVEAVNLVLKRTKLKSYLLGRIGPGVQGIHSKYMSQQPGVAVVAPGAVKPHNFHGSSICSSVLC